MQSQSAVLLEPKKKEFPGFPYGPANVSNLISISSFFSKPSLDMWKFFFHIMLKPSMQDFKHDLPRMGVQLSDG